MLDDSVRTVDEHDDGAPESVGELGCELIPARGAARERARAARSPSQSGGIRPTGAADSASTVPAKSESRPIR